MELTANNILTLLIVLFSGILMIRLIYQKFFVQSQEELNLEIYVTIKEMLYKEVSANNIAYYLLRQYDIESFDAYTAITRASEDDVEFFKNRIEW